MKIPNDKKSVLFALGAVLLWSTVATAFKISLRGLSFAQLLFFASATSTCLLFVISQFQKKITVKQIFNFRDLPRNAVMGWLNPFLYYLILFKAYSLLPAQEAQAVNFTWPIAIAVLSAIVFKQKMKVNTVIGMLIAFAGVFIIITKGSFTGIRFSSFLGDMLALSSAFVWAAFWIISLKDKRANTVKLFGAFLFGTIYTAIFVAVFDSFYIAEKIYILGAVYAGLFEMGITFFLWLKALELSSNKAKTSTLAYLSPFISFMIIAVVLKEKILLSSIAGLILIIGGILFQHLNIKRLKYK